MYLALNKKYIKWFFYYVLSQFDFLSQIVSVLKKLMTTLDIDIIKINKN